MSKSNKNTGALKLHARDGRINPDKAIGRVAQFVKTRSLDEVRRMLNKPVVLKGSDGKPLPTKKKS